MPFNFDFFKRFLKPTNLKVHAAEPEEEEEEEELVDPMEILREMCKKDDPKCKAFHEKLLECNRRVTSRKNTKETCEEELFDFLNHRDHYVSHHLFKNLK